VNIVNPSQHENCAFDGSAFLSRPNFQEYELLSYTLRPYLVLQDQNKRTPLDVAMIRTLTQPCESRTRILSMLEAARDNIFIIHLQYALKNGKPGDIILLSKGEASSTVVRGAFGPTVDQLRFAQYFSSWVYIFSAA
jgi:hypothetical protein